MSGTNGLKSTVMTLLEQAMRESEKDDTAESERIILLLLVSIVNRQNDLHEMVVTLNQSPFVAAGEMLRKHPKLSLATLVVVIAILVVLSNIDLPMILQALEVK